jgi:signal peptidase I
VAAKKTQTGTPVAGKPSAGGKYSAINAPAVESGGKLVGIIEKFLTRRRAKRRAQREAQKKKHFLLDWLDAFLWAVGWVLIINQYLVQAYVIPSGSMIDSLLIGDHIFVNKLIYGPELLPGAGKLPGIRAPARNEIIVFENPSYDSRGTFFDTAQRIIFMLTLSLVDLDKDDRGEPSVHFLIKRGVGAAGDRFYNDRGNLLITPAGMPSPMPESEFNAARGYTHNLSRLMEADAYDSLTAAGRAMAYQNLGLTPPAATLEEARKKLSTIQYPDMLTHEAARLSVLHAADPENPRYSARLAQLSLGWYVPEGRVLPLGDNRDNSRDGRYFGPVRSKKIIGKGSIIYLPGKPDARGTAQGAARRSALGKRFSRIGAVK